MFNDRYKAPTTLTLGFRRALPERREKRMCPLDSNTTRSWMSYIPGS